MKKYFLHSVFFLIMMIVFLSSCALVKKMNFPREQVESSRKIRKEEWISMVIAPQDSVVRINRMDSSKTENIHIDKLVQFAKTVAPFGPENRTALEQVPVMTKGAVRSVINPENVEDASRASLGFGLLALLGVMCGFMILSSPGIWIYIGVILFAIAPITVGASFIAGLVVFGVTKTDKINFKKCRMIAAIGITIGLIALTMLIEFYKENPHFWQ
ncbi:MAG TPA: hypothetical protein VL651_10560 [Bacteroidia bacterium]|jgi:hypothetical protein|nr:hypothetical protein [Bacteroidia bacterium]